MRTLHKSSLSAALATLAFAAGLVAPPVQADDTEVFFTPVGDSDQPNILFILDSSLSMASTAPAPGTGPSSKPAYVVGKEWMSDPDAKAKDCLPNRLYWVTSGSAPTTCEGLKYVEVNLDNPDSSDNKFVCKVALDILRSATSPGYVTQGSIAQYDNAPTNTNQRRWIPLASPARPTLVTECLADNGNHGINSSSLDKRPRNKTTVGYSTLTTGGDYSQALGAFTVSATFYRADWIAWNSIPDPNAAGTTTRMEALKAALWSMAKLL